MDKSREGTCQEPWALTKIASNMSTLNIKDPGLPDLQFVLMVAALCTAEIPTMNAPEEVRRLVFDRCWALIQDTPPPEEPKDRVLNLRNGDEVTLEALVEVIQGTFTDHGYNELIWEHEPSEPTQTPNPEIQPLLDRLQAWDPVNPPPVDGADEAGNN